MPVAGILGPGSHMLRIDMRGANTYPVNGVFLDELRVREIPASQLAWLARYYSPLDLADAARTGDAVDADGDGAGTLWEFLFASSPENAADAGWVRLQWVPGGPDETGRPMVELPWNPAASPASIEVEWSADLASWVPVPASQVQLEVRQDAYPHPLLRIGLTDPPRPGELFLRLRARPLPGGEE